jgi:hypothetical protein
MPLAASPGLGEELDERVLGSTDEVGGEPDHGAGDNGGDDANAEAPHPDEGGGGEGNDEPVGVAVLGKAAWRATKTASAAITRFRPSRAAQESNLPSGGSHRPAVS